jgi:hypothetical protein
MDFIVDWKFWQTDCISLILYWRPDGILNSCYRRERTGKVATLAI